MVNIFNRNYFNRFVLTTILSSVTCSYTLNLPADAHQMVVNEVASMVRLERLVEKLINSKDKGNDKSIGYLVDIKNEIETSYNIQFNLDKCLDNAAKEINKSGYRITKEELGSIRKKIKKEDKKKRDHARYIGNTMYLEGYEFNELDEQLYIAGKQDGNEKSNKDDKDEEVELPALLVYGVTVTLCGVFLMFIPVPTCKEWGSRMVVAGVTACANSISSRTDENKKKEKNKE